MSVGSIEKKRSMEMKVVVVLCGGEAIKIHFGKIISPVNTSICAPAANSPSLSSAPHLVIPGS